MFDIGWGELVLIGLVALIVVGPKELPTVLRTAGQWMGRVKRMASEFQGQFQEALREAEVTDLKQHADDLTGELKSLTDYDPMAGSDTVKDDAGDSDWDEPPFETPEHETPELTEPAADQRLRNRAERRGRRGKTGRRHRARAGRGRGAGAGRGRRQRAAGRDTAA